MEPPVSPYEPVSADEVLSAQFTHIKKGGYDTQEVDGFLDRVAATLDRDGKALPEGSMTSADVRTAEFTQVKRGGYDTKEVDDFLDRVVAVIGAAPATASSPIDPATDDSQAAPVPVDPPPAPAQPIVEVAPTGNEPVPAEPLPSAAGPEMAAPAPRLHDPEGAAQNLLAAAQQAADSLTSNATTFSTETRRDAEQYATATRGEADKHAASVTASAEAQAASIREVAAEEARRAAEQARTELIGEIHELQARQAELVEANSTLESEVATRRSDLLMTLDTLRERVVGELPGPASVAAPEAADDAVLAGVALVEETSDPDDEALDDDQTPPVDVAARHESSEQDQVVTHEPTKVEAETPATDPEDPTADASRSVFDLAPDGPADDSAAWLEAELDIGVPGDHAEEPEPAGLFDIEADPQWEEGTEAAAAPTPSEDEAGPGGDSFFDELRQADADADALGPVDDDTDAALSAFFDGDKENEEESGRWRDRFGPGKG